MHDETPKRFDRIIAILIQLQSRKVVRAQDLAERFDVSLRTIYRDIRSLESSGVPISGETGVGYSLVEGYRLPPVMFSREEALSFVTAEKLMTHFTDTTLRKHFQSALFKIKAVLRDAQRDWIANVESKVTVHPSGELFNTKIPDALEILIDSIAEQRQVHLTYETPDAEVPSRRNIEPVGVFHEHHFWYVWGYCHLRKDYRQFRTDRIVAIQRSSELFTKVHQDLAFYREASENKAKQLVRITMDKPIAKYLHFNRKYYGFVKEIKHLDHVEMVFECDFEHNGMARWLMMFADGVNVLEPQQLREEITNLLQTSLSNMDKSSSS
jgi:predicted DNA-binding transcriptional regulator YafY